MNDDLTIRPAQAEDSHRMMELIQELADYEKLGSEVETTAKDLVKDGFGDKPAFITLLADQGKTTVGMALLYERYSTWKGRTLYLEDLIVTKSARGKGIGERLLKECLSMAKSKGYKRLQWQVLDWNEPAIEFYRKMGVEMDDTWINCKMRF